MATYTEAAQAALATGLSELKLIDTLQLYNQSAGSLYLVNGPEAVTAMLEDSTNVTFQPINFTVEQATSDVPEMTVNTELSNALADWLHASQASRIASSLRYRYYLSTDLTAPATVDPIEMDMGNVAMTDLVAQIKAQFLNLKKRKGPTLRYTNALAPSLTD